MRGAPPTASIYHAVRISEQVLRSLALRHHGQFRIGPVHAIGMRGLGTKYPRRFNSKPLASRKQLMVLRPPSSWPSPAGEKERPAHVSVFSADCPANPVTSFSKKTARGSSSPWGEGRDEGDGSRHSLAGLIAWAVFGGPVWAGIGIVPLLTALIRFCPAYTSFVSATCGKDGN